MYIRTFYELPFSKIILRIISFFEISKFTFLLQFHLYISLHISYYFSQNFLIKLLFLRGFFFRFISIDFCEIRVFRFKMSPKIVFLSHCSLYDTHKRHFVRERRKTWLLRFENSAFQNISSVSFYSHILFSYSHIRVHYWFPKHKISP